MSLIGIEEHWFPPQLTAALLGLPADRRDDSLAFNDLGDHLSRLEDLGDGRIAAMDEQGIDMHIVSVAPPGTGPLNPADAVAISRDSNDFAAAAVSRHPSRLHAMATLPMAQPSAVAEELTRTAGLGFVGAMLYGRTGDVPLDDPRYEELFATAAALGQPLFIHPQIPPPAVRAASYSGLGEPLGLGLATFGWGWHIEAATAALRVIARGTLDRHPDLKLVLGHWGELLLFLSDRTNSLSRMGGLDRKVSEYLSSNFFITSSGMFSPALLHHALEVTTIDHLLFSTDYPFQHPTADDIRDFLGEFASDDDRDKFSSANAVRLFSLGNAGQSGS